MWQLLLKQLLGQAVQEQVRSQVQDAAKKALHPDELDTNRLSPCDVGVIMAMGIEAGPIEDWLTDKIAVTGPTFSVKVGNWQGRRIAVMRAGVGLAAAEAGIAALIAGHQPKWVISAGFGGGLHPDLNVGDLVLANQLVSPHGERLQLDVRAHLLHQLARQFASERCSPAKHRSKHRLKSKLLANSIMLCCGYGDLGRGPLLLDSWTKVPGRPRDQ